MATRDRYSFDIECAKCGEKGELFLSENDYPFGRAAREVDKVEGNFTAEMKDEFKVHILCKNCKESFIWPKT